MMSPAALSILTEPGSIRGTDRLKARRLGAMVGLPPRSGFPRRRALRWTRLAMGVLREPADLPAGVIAASDCRQQQASSLATSTRGEHPRTGAISLTIYALVRAPSLDGTPPAPSASSPGQRPARRISHQRAAAPNRCAALRSFRIKAWPRPTHPDHRHRGFFSMFFSSPFYMQNVLGFSATRPAR